ncbi:MAG: hypothetical protein JW869_03820 [Candidatus Omnitrophica bacterium]|nr:hypothetical protein [Candidatus Omnitrophota bacterium]
MKKFKRFVSFVAIIVLLICIYSFLLGNDVFDKEFSNDALSWYILAKGFFCSLALLLLVYILESVKK